MSKLHDRLNGSGLAVGQTPGLDANSPDRFRAGGMRQVNTLALKGGSTGTVFAKGKTWAQSSAPVKTRYVLGIPVLRGIRVQGHPQLCSKFKATARYVGPCLNHQGWRGGFHGSESFLFLQRTKVQFLVPPWWLTVTYNSSSRGI